MASFGHEEWRCALALSSVHHTSSPVYGTWMPPPHRFQRIIPQASSAIFLSPAFPPYHYLVLVLGLHCPCATAACCPDLLLLVAPHYQFPKPSTPALPGCLQTGHFRDLSTSHTHFPHHHYAPWPHVDPSAYCGGLLRINGCLVAARRLVTLTLLSLCMACPLLALAAPLRALPLQLQPAADVVSSPTAPTRIAAISVTISVRLTNLAAARWTHRWRCNAARLPPLHRLSTASDAAARS